MPEPSVKTALEQSSRDIADWNRIADQYSTQGAESDPTQNPMYSHLAAALWECLGDLHRVNALDLGCGDGWLSGMMHAAGASVLGIDGSDALLDKARTQHPMVEFVQADLAAGIPPQQVYPPRRFHRIVSTMVLMDIPDLAPLMRDASRMLTDDGRFIFVILHPCFYSYKIHFDEASGDWYRKVTNYQDPQVWRVESFGGHNHYHRNLSYYTELLRENGLVITRLYEPEWTSDPADEHARVVRRWPICLMIEARPLLRDE